MLTRTSLTTITASDQGKTALDFLAGRFTYHDRRQWEDEFARGRLSLNGSPARPETPLASGDLLQYFPPQRPEPPVDRSCQVLARHGDLAVIAKSGNLPCHPAGCFFNHTLWALLKEGGIPGLPPQDEIHFISRLDRETSGLVLIAGSKDSARAATRAMSRPEAQKTYRVLVEGDFPEALQARGWLWSSPDSMVKKQRMFTEEAPPPQALHPETASTSFRKLSSHQGISLVEAVLGTGRTHQIRATLASLGYPVVGDKLYGVDPSLYLRFIGGTLSDSDRQRLRLPRQALHAYRLVLPQGPGIPPLDIVAPLPDDMGGMLS